MKKIVFLTGASGVGKTSIVNNMKFYNGYFTCLHFDSIEIPTIEVMNSNFDGPENWQKMMTEDWVRKLVLDYSGKILFEGQVNIDFIISGFKKINYKHYKIFLVDCSVATMLERLITKRKQPELANKNMINWLNFLRKQAGDLGIPIIDTDKLSTEQCCEIIVEEMER